MTAELLGHCRNCGKPICEKDADWRCQGADGCGKLDPIDGADGAGDDVGRRSA